MPEPVELKANRPIRTVSVAAVLAAHNRRDLPLAGPAFDIMQTPDAL
jgi:hypothetical protein